MAGTMTEAEKQPVKTALDDSVKKLSAAAKLHDQVDVVTILIYLKKLHDVVMV
jgi:hypothetical protein